MYFDAHTHLNSDQLFQDRQQELQLFQQSGGVGLVNIGANHVYNTRGLEIAQQSEKIFPSLTIKATIGLHPYEVNIGNITTDNLQSSLTQLQSLFNNISKKHIVGLGEIGIDTHYLGSESTLGLQKELFWLQCLLSRTYKLPIIIHSRSNREATREVIQHFRDCTVYFHCRSYTPEEIKTIQQYFTSYYIGFDANISYLKASNIRESLRYLVYSNTNYPDHIQNGLPVENYQSSIDLGIGINHLLLETDAPYLPFRDRRGTTQHPHYIPILYTYIGTLLGHDIGGKILNNVKQCYKL